MFRFFLCLTLVLACVSTYAAKKNDYSPQIIGGGTAAPHEYPWMAQIRQRNGSGHHCGGALVARNVVLTAAHCVSGFSKNSLEVVLGEHRRNVSGEGEAVFRINRVRIHPSFKQSPLRYDVALITLQGNATITRGLIEIARIGNGPSVGDLVTILGWGATNTISYPGSNALKEGIVEVVPDSACNGLTAFSARTAFCGEWVDATTCYGDSGSPVMRENSNIIEGLVSGGSPGCVSEVAFFSDLSRTWAWLDGWVDYYSESRRASVSCRPAGNFVTSCSYSGHHFRNMDFRWDSTRRENRIVYPSPGSYPYNTKNGTIIFHHPGQATCPSGTRISLTTRFNGLALGSAAFTCH